MADDIRPPDDEKPVSSEELIARAREELELDDDESPSEELVDEGRDGVDGEAEMDPVRADDLVRPADLIVRAPEPARQPPAERPRRVPPSTPGAPPPVRRRLGLMIAMVVGIAAVGVVAVVVSFLAADDGADDAPVTGGDPSPTTAATGPSTNTDFLGLPDTLGDDPTLDVLWEDCERGDRIACDSLWMASPLGSGYEAFALTCGGGEQRSLIEMCVDMSDGPTVLAIVDACAADDYAACDVLYLVTLVGSDEEAFSLSCGGLVADARDPFTQSCIDLFGLGSRG